MTPSAPGRDILCAQARASIPDGLNPVEAAPLLCAGRTTFGALQNSVAQFAIRLGFETAVLSRGREKEALARKLGAHHFIDTNTADAARELINLGGAKVILCTAPNGKAISELVDGLCRNGQMMVDPSVAGLEAIQKTRYASASS